MLKYFVSHEENGERPYILRPQAVAFVIMIVLVLQIGLVFTAARPVFRSELFGTILVNALIDGSNSARAANDLPPLRENPLLDAAAEEKANDMVKNNYFAHTSPAGVSPWYWFGNVGYQFAVAGENLAVNFSDSADVTSAWLNSPLHRANILDVRFTEIGMATAQGTFDGHTATYVVELFGLPDLSLWASLNRGAAQKSAPVKSASVKKLPREVSPVTAVMPAIATRTEPIEQGPVEAAAVVRETNPIQQAASDPRRTADYIYLAIIVLFALSLAANAFMKLHLRHPQLILGGMLVILVAGLFIVLNAHSGVQIL